ncbi:MAG: aldose epimerase family protein [Planctomycetales bacterium]
MPTTPTIFQSRPDRRPVQKRLHAAPSQFRPRLVAQIVSGLLLIAAGPLPHLPAAAPLTAQKGNPVSKTPFGKTPDGASASLFTCTNSRGATAQFTDYGARLVALRVPDRDGTLANVTLGFDTLEKYMTHTAFFGCTTGRYANRIAHARFALDGQEYKLAANNGTAHLHGGKRGFDRYVWKAEEIHEPHASGVRFTHRSPDGDEGYPGTLDMTVTMLWTDENEWKIHYAATTDKSTVLNLTNHAYWNLSGAGEGKVLDHRLTLESDQFLPVGEAQIPTGELAQVRNTFMDFTAPKSIGSRIADTKSPPLPLGYDHCYVLRHPQGKLSLAARVEEPSHGRIMEVYTTEPAVQLYTGNFLDGSPINGGFQQHSAFCLETQHYPDSPNQPKFPTTVLKPGLKFESTTVYKFGVK